jgi:DNA-binding transcriptional MerR regulator
MDQNLAIGAASPFHAETEAWDGQYASTAPAGADAPSTIADVAREFGITLRALRFYESRHLIAPLRVGATRLYRREDRARLALILIGRRLGFTLAEIGTLIAGQGADHPLHLTRQKCVEQITLLERQKRTIEVAIAELRQIYTSFYNKRAEAAAARP